MILNNSPGFFFCSLFMILATLALGCGPASMAPVTATSPVKGLIVNVREFDASRADVKDYSEPVQPYGLQTAEAIVEALQEAGIAAQIAPSGAPPAGQVIVEGRVTMVEGGSTTSRVLLGGFGPVGASRFGVAGSVRRDGMLLGEFAVDRLAWMDLWWPSADRLLSRTARVIGFDIANMISSGRYSRGSSNPASTRTTAERLHELEGLLDKGLVTREEYEQKRAVILKQL